MHIYKKENELFCEEYRSKILAAFSSKPRNSRCRKTQLLKSRLSDRVLSANPQPSVPRPKVSHSSKRLPTVPNLSSLVESRLMIRPLNTQISITTSKTQLSNHGPEDSSQYYSANSESFGQTRHRSYLC